MFWNALGAKISEYSVSWYRRSCQEMKPEYSFNLRKIKDVVEKLPEIVATTLIRNLERKRWNNSSGLLTNFTGGDLVILDREKFKIGEASSLRRGGSRRIAKTESNYVYQVDDLISAPLEEDLYSSLRFYSYFHLDKEAIIPHVLYLLTLIGYRTTSICILSCSLALSPKVKILWHHISAFTNMSHKRFATCWIVSRFVQVWNWTFRNNSVATPVWRYFILHYRWLDALVLLF